jgi:hypothetical protein
MGGWSMPVGDLSFDGPRLPRGFWVFVAGFIVGSVATLLLVLLSV